IGGLSSTFCFQSTAEADSYVNQNTDAKANNIKDTAIGRCGGLLPGPISRNGANRSDPNASPGKTNIPSTIKSALANWYFNNWYKNKKYQSGNGRYEASEGFATPSSGVGATIVAVKNPTKKTEPTSHSFNRKLGQKASVRPGYSE